MEILIVGGGYVGMYTARRLFRRETTLLASLEHPADDFRDAFRAA